MNDFEYANSGYLPYDGGDEAPSQSLQGPFKHRVARQGFSASYSSYSGSSQDGTIELYNTVEALESRRHPVSWLGRSKGNIGGKFVHTKLHVDKFGDAVALYRGGSTWRKANGVMAASSGFLSDISPGSTEPSYDQAQAAVANLAPLSGLGELNAAGTTAIARVAPTNPLVDLSTSVAELYREGLPQVAGVAQNPGGEYLNIMFGWVPLVGDGTAYMDVARRADALLEQHERDSGRWIRRGYNFEDQVDSTTSTQTNAVPALLGVSPSGLVVPGTRTITRTTITRTWFSGAFTYYLPRTGWRRRVSELDYLYGIRPGIDTAWQLTGYSWLVDYFTNVGDVMKNLTAFGQDGLVMPYGYIMRERMCIHEETWSGALYIGGVAKPAIITSQKTYKTQQRRLATPFGFGVNLDGLTGRQVSILAALGISRRQGLDF